MKHKIFKYLKEYSTKPSEIDRLIISSFIKSNELIVKHNILLMAYVVTPKQKNEYKKVQEFLSVLNTEVDIFSFEVLIELFEFVISPEDRLINGAIYTPQYIRNYIINQSLSKTNIEVETLKCADIACGCGGFLYDLAKKLKFETNQNYKSIFENNIFGLDIQDYSITRTKLLLSLLALSEGEDIAEFKFNLYVGDTLEFDWKAIYNEFTGFDIIVGNPPYVRLRNLNNKTKSLLKNWEVCKIGLTDLYIPFFQIGIECLSKNGILGYITMNSFFKSLNGRALRDYFQRKKYTFQIIDFGAEQVFKSKSTYTCICFIQSNQSDYIEYIAINNNNLNQEHKFDKIPYESLNSKKGWNLKSIDIVNIIETIGIPFKEMFTTRHGIATLKNNIYIFKPIKEDEEFFYLQNGSLYKIEKGICRDIVNPNKLKRKSDFKKIKEKILFPYNNDNQPQLLEENVLKERFPKAYKYLKDKKSILAERDKGKGNYKRWYAFGRTQSLERKKNKLFFPKIANKSPNCIIKTDDELYYYNGQAILAESKQELELIQKILKSDIFWFYITQTSKPYNSNYFSLNGTYINNFGIPNFSDEDKKYITTEKDYTKVNSFITSKYGIELNLNDSIK